ncbi:effector-associated constant component EACC1 [Streptomyces sp. 4N509B]|uniref:effector-associated constant component EACC1 n=1 Tax=Streptomyces sp. 4N509B TaxID=3457413 RepID=UPI003FD1B4A5
MADGPKTPGASKGRVNTFAELRLGIEGARDDESTAAENRRLHRWLTTDRELNDREGFRVTRHKNPEAGKGGMGTPIEEILVGWDTTHRPDVALALLGSLQGYLINLRNLSRTIVVRSHLTRDVLTELTSDNALPQRELKQRAERLAREWHDHGAG